MNAIFRFGSGALATAAFSLTSFLSNADTLAPANAFSKHGLPVPGTYLKNKDAERAPVVVTKSGKTTANANPTASKGTKKQAKQFRYTVN